MDNSQSLKERFEEALVTKDEGLLGQAIFRAAQKGDIEYVKKLYSAGADPFDYIYKDTELNSLGIALINNHLEVVDFFISRDPQMDKKDYVKNLAKELIAPDKNVEKQIKNKFQTFKNFYSYFEKDFERPAGLLDKAVKLERSEIFHFLLVRNDIEWEQLNSWLEFVVATQFEEIKSSIESFKVFKSIEGTVKHTSKSKYDDKADLSTHDLLNVKCQFGFDGLFFQVPQFVMGLFSHRAEEILEKIHDQINLQDVVFGKMTFEDILVRSQTRGLYTQVKTHSLLHKPFMKPKHKPLRRYS